MGLPETCGKPISMVHAFILARSERAACPVVAFCHAAFHSGRQTSGQSLTVGFCCAAPGCLEPHWHLPPMVPRSIHACCVHAFVLASGPRTIVSTLPRTEVQPVAALPWSLSLRDGIHATLFGHPFRHLIRKVASTVNVHL